MDLDIISFSIVYWLNLYIKPIYNATDATDCGRKRKHKNINSTRKVKMSGDSGSLVSSYGSVTLSKGMKLYHACSKAICSLPDKPVLFLTLHPSEWYMEDAHIATIELQNDVTLLFMIKDIIHMRILSSLNDFLAKPNSNLAKMNYDNVKQWIPYLQHESLDGWMSSIDNKTSIEFAIINDPRILKIVDCSPIQYNWSNSTINKPKNWGTMYPVYSYMYPVKMHLHERFRDRIEAYKKKVSIEDPLGTAFSVLLETAIITYFTSTIDKSIYWKTV